MPGGRSLAALWLAITLGLVAAFSLSAGIAQASSARPGANAITITSQTQTYTYATRMTFQVQASDSAGTINKAELEIKVAQIGMDRRITVPVPQPGATVSLAYRYDPGSDYLPPFTPITYHWMLSDNTQHSLTGADQHFDFADTRFTWSHLTKNDISIYWYHQNTAYGQNLLNTAVKEATSIEQDLHGTLTDPIHVLVYASDQDLRGGLPSDTPNWAGGVALIPLHEALIVVGDAQYPLQRDLPHELTHLILHEIAGLGCGGCPLWFDEGMAVYHQIYHEPDLQYAFDTAVHTQKHLLSFNTLTDRFPDDAEQAELAYAQSWKFITYLYSTFGQPKVARLVDALPTTAFSTAFSQAFGLSVDKTEDQWRKSLGLKPTTNSPQATPSTSNTPGGSQTSDASANEGSGNGPIEAIGLGFALLLLVGLAGVVFLLRRSRQAPAPVMGPGGAWPASATAAPAPFGAMSPGYPPPGAPQGIATDEHFQRQIAQRQALLWKIDLLIAAEKRLSIQRTEIERQIALYAAQEREARAENSENRAMLALDRRQKLETHIPYLRQQIEQARLQKEQALEMERRISAEIGAAFNQPMRPANVNANAGLPWPQPGGAVSTSARRVSQE
jgi:hypothetical protein